jgi:hypothetical protein
MKADLDFAHQPGCERKPRLHQQPGFIVALTARGANFASLSLPGESAWK